MRNLGWLLLASLLPLAGLAACQSDDTTTGGSGGDTSGNGASSSETSTSSSSGSGMGGSSSSGMTGPGGGGSSTGGSGGMGTGGAAVGDHLLISEIAVNPAAAEFIEIYNPTSAAVDLTDYYLSDNSAYFGIAADQPWMPVGTAETDFLARFPPGASIPAGGAIAIAADPDFEMQFNKCPDYILAAADVTCANGTAKAMVAPTNGGIGTMAGSLLSNDREMLMLFTWDGAANVVTDVDYLTWGAMFVEGTRVDKTGVAGYQPDTAPDMQKPAPAPPFGQSIERCSTVENGEKLSGGNGTSGHDETSEALDTSFTVQAAPTPGAKNACL